MARRLVVFVHGMGSFVKGWSTDPAGPQTKLIAVADKYAEVTGLPGGGGSLGTAVTYGEILYDDIFSKLVDQWSADGDALAQWATAAGHALPKLTQWLAYQAPTDTVKTNFFWTTAIDPLFYRGFALVRDAVRVHVMSQLVSLISSIKESVNLTIVAHSLGTAVIHDVLHLIGTNQAPASVGDVSALMPPNFMIDNIIMIADVCRLGPAWVHDIDYYGSICRPSDGATNGDCTNFAEVWHRYDPFAILAPFRPTTWGDGYQGIGPVQHFRQLNVHSVTHYLDNPAVHIPIINMVLGGPVIGSTTQANAISQYADIISPQCTQQIEIVKAKAAEFEGMNDDLEALVIEIAEFYAAVEAAKAQCPALAGGF